MVIEWGKLPNVGFQRSCKSEDLLRALSFIRPFDSSGKQPAAANAAFAMEIVIGQQLLVAEEGADARMQVALAPQGDTSAAVAQSILQQIPPKKLQKCRFSGINSQDQSISLVSAQVSSTTSWLLQVYTACVIMYTRRSLSAYPSNSRSTIAATEFFLIF